MSSLGKVANLAAAVLCAGLGACGGGGAGGGRAPAAAPARAGGAASGSSGVTSLGSEPPSARLAALRAVPAPGPFDVPLAAGGSAQVNLWPDACSVLTPAQVKAVIPGNYTPVPIGSAGLAPPGGAGAKPARPTVCVWQLGGGRNGSSVTVTLEDQEPASVQAAGLSGDGPVADLGNGIKCAYSIGTLSCEHQSWTFSLSGRVHHRDLSSNLNSRALADDWLMPLASAVGSVLQGS